MQQTRDLEPRPPLAPGSERSGGRPTLAALRRGWRGPLMGALALLAIALALISSPRPPGDVAPVPTLAPISGNPESAWLENRVVAPAGAVPSALPQPSPAPRPTATPSAIRPLAAPTMPPVANSRSAPVRNPGTPDPDPSTDHVIVVDGDSGAVLFELNSHEAIAPASLTKIMTALLGIEYGDLSEHVRVDVSARDLPDSTVMGLEPWFDVTLEDILYGLMLPSGNDAALAIGRYVSGSDEAFVELMNQRAAGLGLTCTRFANPHGLDAPGHYSCPADMVTLARYAMQYPEFRKLAAARTYDIRRSNIAYTIENLNPILWSYPGADGVKIGYTDDAGRSMVATAVQNGHRVYVAFMRSSAGLAPDTRLLLDWAFNSHTWPGD